MICQASPNADRVEKWALTVCGWTWDAARARSKMRSRSSPTDPGFLRRLYVDERLSAIAIATRLGCSGTTILRRLRRLGIGIRPRGPVPPVGIATITWHPDVAYALGLMATDGNLSSRRGTMSLVSKDPDQIPDSEEVSSAPGPCHDTARPESIPLQGSVARPRPAQLVSEPRAHAGEKSYHRAARGSRRAFRGLLSRLRRRRMFCPRCHRDV